VSIMTLDISTLSDSAEDMAMLNALTQQVDTTIANMTTAASDVGAVKSRIGLQQSFVTSLKDSIDMGVGSLVDADMNQESTRLQALQVQQQLGIQSLSIANQSAQAILKLFG
jgi:flagellin